MNNEPFFYFDQTSAYSLATIIDYAIDMSGCKGYIEFSETDKKSLRSFTTDLWKIANLQRLIYTVSSTRCGNGGTTMLPVCIPKDFADQLIDMGEQYRKDHP